MAQRIQHYAVVASSGSDPANPQIIPVTFTRGRVLSISVHVPSGHAGQTGFSLSYGETQVIPFAPQAYLSGNHKTYRFDFDDPFPGGSGWEAQVYNRGRYSHTFRLSISLEELGDLGAASLPPVILLPLVGA